LQREILEGNYPRVFCPTEEASDLFDRQTGRAISSPSSPLAAHPP
jgi:hypothetical protein